MMLKKENLPHLHQFLPTFWCDRFDKMVEKVAGSAFFHSFFFFFGRIFPKKSLYLFVNFLIALANRIRKPADRIRKPTERYGRILGKILPKKKEKL